MKEKLQPTPWKSKDHKRLLWKTLCQSNRQSKRISEDLGRNRTYGGEIGSNEIELVKLKNK